MLAQSGKQGKAVQLYKLASNVNLYRFTIFANPLVGATSPNPFEHHLAMMATRSFWAFPKVQLLDNSARSYFEKVPWSNLHRRKNISSTPLDKLVLCSSVKYNEHRQLNRVCGYSLEYIYLRAWDPIWVRLIRTDAILRCMGCYMELSEVQEFLVLAFGALCNSSFLFVPLPPNLIGS